MSNEDRQADPAKRKWRKKPKTVLSNAKKYMKKGQMGRGKQMPDEIYQYFVGILDVLKRGVDTEEERAILVKNVLERTKDAELNIIENQLGSYVIEVLLPYASQDDLERYMTVVHPDLRRLCCDTFTSHTVQQLITVAADRASGTENEEDEEEPPLKKKPKTSLGYSDEHIEKCKEFTLTISKYVLNNLEDFLWDNYANHIVRACIRSLAGLTYIPGEKSKKTFIKITEEDTKDKKIRSLRDDIGYKSVPEEFRSVLLEFGERIIKWPQFKDMPFKNLTSGFLQILLMGLNNVDKKLTKNMIRKILDESFAPDFNDETVEDKKDVKPDVTDRVEEEEDKEQMKEDKEELKESDDVVSNVVLPPVFKSEPAARLLEAALLVAKKKTYTQIYAKCFINRFSALVTRSMVNFSVQRLFDRCRVQEEFEAMFDEISECFGAIIVSNNKSILTAVAKACLRLKAKQTQFVAALETALGCKDDSKYFAVACLRLLPINRIDKGELSKPYLTEIHGSVILQTVLEFQRPTKVVNSLLELSSSELLVIFKDPKGSRISDSFFRGQFVGAKSREKIFHKLKGNFQELISSQHGSRAFDALYDSCTPELKVKIMEEVTPKCQLMNGTPWGRIVATKLNIELFKASREKWLAAINKESKAKNLFADIVDK